ncbi:MAG: amino acid carrier protein, partial [Candidatus Marinimicrobia bacterium]|nr:amino acid carrier protein [Candidatus Neomarinimicrobiota bacterium]
MVEYLDNIMSTFAEVMWSMPLVVALISSGIFFTLFCRLIPFRYLGHAVNILRGKYDSDDDPGQISHFEALSSALASTVGMGNIAGVAVAIHTGGPGVLFWMWLSAIIGMGTKFFTCTLAVMYRGEDDSGEIQGGPMYFIETGLGKKFKPLAVFFSISGMFGCLTFFQANQLAQIIRDFVHRPLGLFQESQILGDGITGICVAIVVGIVVFGGIKRIAKVASRLVPLMVGIYFLSAIFILLSHIGEIPSLILLIFNDAFTGDAVLGGALGSLIIIGIKRGVFSNEAGTGTEAMAHGAAKTKEPVREG